MEAPQPNTKRDLLALLEKLVMWQAELENGRCRTHCLETEVLVAFVKSGSAVRALDSVVF